MATIDYKEKYEQAMERARQFIEKPYLEDSAGIVEFIFPELAESEDEKIRKEIINYFEHHPNIIVKRERKSDWIAWLEKQGEQKSNIVPIFKVGDIIKNKKNGDTVKVEQILIDSYCYSGWDGAATIHSDFLISDQGNWELVEQKPAWSEEDEKMWSQVINEFEAIKSNSSTVFEKNIAQDKIDFLKALKERYAWRPSEEQMNALDDVISSRDIKYDVLSELWKDLNKIREE